MIDFDDVNETADVGFWTTGWVSFIFLVLAIALYFIARSNQEDCSVQRCADGSAAVLMGHACRCVSKPLKP